MGTKTKRDYNDPLAIFNEMAALDRKDYGYYDRLTDEQKKKFSPYLMMRWGSTVEGNDDISKYYAVSVNEFVNMNFWDLGKHPKLQWLCCCTASPGIGKQRHYWLGGNKTKTSSGLKNILMEKFPATKESDIDLMLKVKSKEDIKEWLRQCGIEDKILKPL